MPRLARSTFALVTLLLVALGQPASAQQARQFDLKHLTAEEVLTPLRAVAGARQIEVVGERTLLVNQPEAMLTIVEGVLGLLDVDPEASPGPASFDVVPGEDVVTRIPLRKVEAADAIAALRSLSVRQLAVSANPPSVLIRGTSDRCEESKSLLASLEAATK